MALILAGRTITRVAVVEDDPGARQSYGYPIEDLGVEPVLEGGPLGDIARLVDRLVSQTDGALCDYRLRTSNYATFNGDELVARLYERKFPALLCTRFMQSDVDMIRRHRRLIPALYSPDQLDTDAIISGFKRCFMEFEGSFAPSRKPWRTLVRVEEMEPEGAKGYFYVVLPGWSLKQAVRLRLADVPTSIRSVIKPGSRLHAQVNVGAETQHELYFDAWEQQ